MGIRKKRRSRVGRVRVFTVSRMSMVELKSLFQQLALLIHEAVVADFYDKILVITIPRYNCCTLFAGWLAAVGWIQDWLGSPVRACNDMRLFPAH